MTRLIISLFTIFSVVGCREKGKEKHKPETHRIWSGTIIGKNYLSGDCYFTYGNGNIIDTVQVPFDEFEISNIGDTLTLNKDRAK